MDEATIAKLMAELKEITQAEATRLLKGDTTISVSGSDGNEFELKSRINPANPLDFCLILEFKRRTGPFKLRRYNGNSHQHRNRLEKETLTGFHIHKATERYQALGRKEEAFAEATSRYHDVVGAWTCMMQDCNIVVAPPDDPMQGRLI